MTKGLGIVVIVTFGAFCTLAGISAVVIAWNFGWGWWSVLAGVATWAVSVIVCAVTGIALDAIFEPYEDELK